MDISLSNSKTVYASQSRYLTKVLFEKKLINGTKRCGYYLVYSSKKKLYFMLPVNYLGTKKINLLRVSQIRSMEQKE